MAIAITATNAVSPPIRAQSGRDNSFARFNRPVANDNINSLTAFEQIIALQSATSLGNTSSTNSSNANANNSIASVFDDATLLDLSPQALNVLNGVGASANGILTNPTLISNVLANVAGSGLFTLGNNPGVNLTETQLDQLAAVVAPFSDEPLSNQTFLDIQQALLNAGFDPQTISLQSILLAMNNGGLGSLFNSNAALTQSQLLNGDQIDA